MKWKVKKNNILFVKNNNKIEGGKYVFFSFIFINKKKEIK